MNDDRGIKLITDELGAAHADPLDAVDQGIENDELEALLRLCADESSAEIDFEAIKQRAVSSALKKAKRSKRRRAASYALFACASLVIGLTLFSVLRSLGKPNGAGITVLNSSDPVQHAQEDPNTTGSSGGFRGSDGNSYPVWRMVGAVSNDAYKDISKKASDLVPDELPENMMTLVDNDSGHISAIGTDGNGEGIYYDVVLSTEPPIELETGEACSIEDGDCIVYYWQVSEDSCMSVRIAGCEQQRADSMFNSLANRIVQIVPDDGHR